MLINGSLITLPAFELTVNVDADTLVTTITYPAGIAFYDYELTAGAFVDPTWTILDYEANVTRTLTLTVIVTDAGLFSALAPEDRVVEGDTDVLVGEVVVANNHAEKLITDVTCVDILNCGSCSLTEFYNMEQAIETIGYGKAFIAALGNTEGWSYRALIFTPCNEPIFSLTCPEDMEENECPGIALSDQYPTITTPCGDLVFVQVNDFVQDPDTFIATWIVEYENIDCDDCEDIPETCCPEGGYFAYASAVATPIPESDNYEVVFTVEDSCLNTQSCSYIFVSAFC